MVFFPETIMIVPMETIVFRNFFCQNSNFIYQGLQVKFFASNLKADCEKFQKESMTCFLIFELERHISGSHNAKTAFTRCRHILKMVKNSTDRPPVHTKMALFMPADFENGRF